MKKLFSSFSAWVDGQKPFPLKTEYPAQNRAPVLKDRSGRSDREKLRIFSRFYTVCCLMICALILFALLSMAVSMPEFGSDTNPTVNEVSEHYVGKAESETGAENVIAGMILNYRGFDTFGESCVLFLAVCCVIQLLWHTGGSADTRSDSGKDAAPDVILSRVCQIVIPCVLCFGICVLFNGHVSPGGGFSGGSTLGAALILFAVAYGEKDVSRFFTRRVFDFVRIAGLAIYALMFGVYIFQGANGISSDLAHYIVLVIDIAVGLVVMSTMYGFYSFYIRGYL